MCDGLQNWFYQLKRNHRTFACVHGRYVLYQIFPNGDRQTQRFLMYLLLLVVEKIIFLLSNPLKFSKISYLTSLAKASSAEFRVYLSSLALLVELIYKVTDDYHYHNHSNHYHHQHCRYRNQ